MPKYFLPYFISNAYLFLMNCTCSRLFTTSFFLQALECSVAGITPVTDSWMGVCCIAVRQLVAGKSLTLTVVDTPENDRTYAVDILLTPIGTVSQEGYGQLATVKNRR